MDGKTEGTTAPDDTPRDGDALDTLIDLALTEDVGSGDWTTRWTVEPGQLGEATISAKQPLVVAGVDAARRVFAAVDPAIRVEVRMGDGERAGAGDVVVALHGPLSGILTAERTALNFLGRLSGIATLTSEFVAAVAGTGARVIDTRKTTPGFRALEKAAVRAGGGHNHRVGLHDMVLIKENHIVAAGGVAQALRRVASANTRGLKVEIEVRDLRELKAALREGPDRILLDNMSLGDLRRGVEMTNERSHDDLGSRPLLEASGNVRLDTVRAIAETGVDLISVGALTHSAAVADLSLRVPALERS